MFHVPDMQSGQSGDFRIIGSFSRLLEGLWKVCLAVRSAVRGGTIAACCLERGREEHSSGIEAFDRKAPPQSGRKRRRGRYEQGMCLLRPAPITRIQLGVHSIGPPA